jgi:diamine N-acetyltransferase
MPDINYRKFKPPDQAAIQQWPPYPREFAGLDYALRSNGWLDEFHESADTAIYIAEQDNEIIAFTLLAKTAPDAAEFRIAVRADKLGTGIGKSFTNFTLLTGYTKLGLSRIHLVVRKNNPRAIRLYKQAGFYLDGECIKTVNGESVDFWVMAMLKPA